MSRGVGVSSQVHSVNVEISVVLGRASLPMQQLLRMGRGAVIPLDATVNHILVSSFTACVRE